MRPELERILAKDELSREDIVSLLDIADPAEEATLFARAYEVKRRHVGTKVHFRGLIELSNLCAKNCFYCGIRRGNASVSRYTLSEAEVLDAAAFAHGAGYGSLVLQGGERQDGEFIARVERMVRLIKEASNNELGITLSLGEQAEETYRRWFAAGAHRYLLRIETSNPSLYRSLHPEDHDFDSRIEALRALGRLGYQVGTGVMIGLPGQTTEDLAGDIGFFREMDVAMIGMGPYIPHHDTPLAGELPDWRPRKEERLRLALRMIAVTRIVLKDVNIASTTALQAIDAAGREMGLLAGANVIMPNMTDTKYRSGYRLYEDKPGLDENARESMAALERSIAAVGETIGWNEWGDSPHFLAAKKADNDE